MGEHCKFDYSYNEGEVKPWLVQRLKFKDEPDGPSLDGLVMVQYMGSAEYEFGALPRSLKRICANFDQRKIYTNVDKTLINYEGRPLYLFAASTEHAVKYFEALEKMSKDEYAFKFKERPSFFEHFPNEEKFKDDPVMYPVIKERAKYARESVDVWWDIEYDVFFTFGQKPMEAVVHAIMQTRNRKREEKAEGWY